MFVEKTWCFLWCSIWIFRCYLVGGQALEGFQLLHVRDLSFSQWFCRRFTSSGMWRSVIRYALVFWMIGVPSSWGTSQVLQSFTVPWNSHCQRITSLKTRVFKPYCTVRLHCQFVPGSSPRLDIGYLDIFLGFSQYA
jgi:hypothetical protein